VLVAGRLQSEPDLALSTPKFSERALALVAILLNKNFRVLMSQRVMGNAHHEQPLATAAPIGFLRNR
jgi:hypothetical protein